MYKKDTTIYGQAHTNIHKPYYITILIKTLHYNLMMSIASYYISMTSLLYPDSRTILYLQAWGVKGEG